MLRLIPKKTKIVPTVYKNFNLYDILLTAILFIFAILIVMSNFGQKWIILIAYLAFSVLLFVPIDENKTYLELAYIIVYIFSRKKYKKGSKKSSVDGLIPFDSISADGIVSYNGYNGAIVEVESVEFGLLDAAEQDRRISVIAGMFNDLNSDATIQIVKIDRPINYDEVAAVIFNKLQASRGDTDNMDMAKNLILESRLAQIDNLNNIAKNYRPYYYIIAYELNTQDLLTVIDNIRASLGKAGLESKYLSGEEAAVFFKYCYTRFFDEREISGVAPENYADWVKPDSIRFNSTSYTCDDIYAFTCAVTDFPLQVGNAWGAELFNIDGTKVVLTIKPVPKDKAVKRIDRSITELNSKSQSGKISEVISNETQVQTTAILAQSIQNENELLFDCTMTITGFNNTKMKESVFRKELRRKITAGGFKISFLRGRQFSGFAAASVSKRTGIRSAECGINSESLAAVFPFVFTSVIEQDGFYLGYYNYPVILDIKKRSSMYVNSNITVFGKSGSGKSFFTKTLLSMVYSENSRIFILDPENEYNVLCKNVGGKFVDVGNAVEGRLNPLHIYQIMTDDGAAADPETVFSSQLRFIDSFFRITLKGISADSLEELNNIVPFVYKRKGIDEHTDCSAFKPDMFPTFDDLLAVVEDEIAKEKLQSRLDNLDRVKTYVKKFAKGGRYAELWNGPSTLVSEERLTVFNFQSLFGSKNTEVANGQMLTVMRYLDQQIINIREINRGGADIFPFVVLDEGYNFIDPEYPVALDFVYMWYKRIRKYNGSIMFLTQNLSDILGNSEVVAKTTAIINNAQYSFIFSLAPADLELLADLYKNAGGLNETEKSTIANAGNGDCFAICSLRERTSFHVEASDVVRSIFDDKNAAAALFAPPHAAIIGDDVPADYNVDPAQEITDDEGLPDFDDAETQQDEIDNGNLPDFDDIPDEILSQNARQDVSDEENVDFELQQAAANLFGGAEDDKNE